MNPDMSVLVNSSSFEESLIRPIPEPKSHITSVPLKIVWPWILVFSIGTERTDVARGIVYQAVPDHLVFPLEAFAALTPWATLDTAVVWSI